jgi:hypothetical protein
MMLALSQQKKIFLTTAHLSRMNTPHISDVMDKGLATGYEHLENAEKIDVFIISFF